MSEFIPPDDSATLARMELLGSIARACRLALQEFEVADSVSLQIDARAEGVTVDVQLFAGGQPVGGWGV